MIKYRKLARCQIAVGLLLAVATCSTAFAQLNRVLVLDGFGDYVEVPDVLEGLTSCTVEAWFRYESSATTGWVFGGGPGFVDGIGIGLPAGSSLLVSHFRAADTGLSIFSGLSGISVSSQTWHHVALTYDGGLVRVYIDGAFDFSVPASGPVQTLFSQAAIGAGNWDGGEFWNGGIDEVRLWNVARSASNIAQQRFSRLSGAEAGLLAYWNFDNGSAEDATGNAYHGSFVGDAHAGVEALPMPFGVGSPNHVLALDGNGHVLVNHATSLNPPSGEITMSAWIKKTTANHPENTVAAVVEKTSSGASANGGYELGFDDRSAFGRSDNFFINIGGNEPGLSDVVRIMANDTMTDSEWHHILGTYRLGEAHLYLDGVEVPHTREGGYAGPVGTNSLPLHIGVFSGFTGGSSTFEGLYDNISIWDRALTKEEVECIDWTHLSGGEDGLVAYYTFADGLAEDRSGSAHDGTFEGTATTLAESTPNLSASFALEVYFDADYPTSQFLFQFADPPAYTNWTGLGEPVSGRVGEVQLYDAMRKHPFRAYRVLTQ